MKLRALFLALALFCIAPAIAQAQAPTCAMTVTPATIVKGGSVTLRWQSSPDVTEVAISNLNISPAPVLGREGSLNLIPLQSTRYRGVFKNARGTATCEASVLVTLSNGNATGFIEDPGVVPDPGRTDSTPPSQGPAPTLPTAGDLRPTGGPSAGIVPCTGINCEACHLAKLGQNIINFLLGLSIPLAAALFAWAGVLLFTAGDDTGRVTRARNIFKSVLIGFLVVLGAWLGIQTVMKTILKDKYYQSWNSIQCVGEDKRPTQIKFNDFIQAALPFLNTKPTVPVEVVGSGFGGGNGCAQGTENVNGMCVNVENGIVVGPAQKYVSPTELTTCYSGHVLQGGYCVGGDEPYKPFSQSLGSSGPGGTCPGGYAYAEDAEMYWCQGPGGANDWAEVMEYPKYAGGTAQQCNNGNCSPEALMAAGFNQTAANVMSCIAVTESSGMAYKCNGNACGTFQIMLTVNPLVGPACGGTLNCPSLCKGNKGAAVMAAKNNQNDPCYPCLQAALNPACNAQAAQYLYSKSGYAPWTTNSDNTKSGACVQKYGNQ